MPANNQEIILPLQKTPVTFSTPDAYPVRAQVENGTTVAGAVFGIYNKEDIKAAGKVIVKAETFLQEMTSDNIFHLKQN